MACVTLMTSRTCDECLYCDKDAYIAALRVQLKQAEEVIQGRNGRIVYLERQCAKADQDVKDASEDRGFAIKELAKVSAALAARDAELERYKESFKPVVNAIKWVASEGPHESASLIAETLLVGCKEAVRRLDGGER